MKNKVRLIFFILIGFFVALPAMGQDRLDFSLHKILQETQALMDKGQAGEAAKILENFRQKKTGEHYLLDFVQANAYLASNRPKKAVPFYKATLNKKPDFFQAHNNLGKSYFDLGKMVKAGQCFEKAYKTSMDKDPEVLFYAASCYVAANEQARAIEIFDRLILAHKGKTSVKWKEGMVSAMLSIGMTKKALPMLIELANQTKGKKQRQWQEVLLFKYMELNMDDQAFFYARSLIHKAPTDPTWWRALSNLYLARENYEDALSSLMIYGFAKPLTIDEKKLVADLFAVTGIPGQAVRYYEQALDRKTDPAIIKKLIQNCQRLGDFTKALSWTEKALKNSSDFELLMSRGHIFYKMKEYKKAAMAFEKAAKSDKNKNPGQAWLMAGYSAINAQDKHRASAALKKAAKYEHSRKAAQNLLRR